MIGQFNFGMHRQGSRWEIPFKGTLIQSCQLHSHQKYIVSGSDDSTIQLWDVQTGGQVGNTLQEHTDLVRSVAFSPDGRHIVSGSFDGTIQLWNAQTGG